MNQRDLEGISALVTGASSGIGRAAAEELGRHGAEIVVHGRDAGRGSAVAGTITAAGGKARFVAADLTDPDQLDDLVEQAGTVDVLVNNAGFSWFGPTAELDVATFDRLFAANVRAPYFLVGALAPKMARTDGASTTTPATAAIRLAAIISHPVRNPRYGSIARPTHSKDAPQLALHRFSLR